MQNKKVIFFSTFDTDGGASEVIYRMANALVKANFEVLLLVRHKIRTDSFIVCIPNEGKKKSYFIRLINLLKRIFKIKNPIIEFDQEYAFFPGEDETENEVSVDKILDAISFTPDIIIAGLTYNFVNTTVLKELHQRTGAKVFQVMYDMNAVTGGCHVVWDCDRFKNDCNDCPAIKTDYFKIFAHTNLVIKYKNIKACNMGLLVAPGWSLFQANQSTLFKNGEKLIISVPIDLTIFTNANRDIAKRIFNIKENNKIIFAGSINIRDKRKGREFLVEALSILWENLNECERDKVCILIAGNNNLEDELILKIKFRKHLLDFIKDYRLLSLVYQASDVFVCPSIEDAGPMMVNEALACGTPVVGFKMGSLFDDAYIINGYNGYSVTIKDSKEISDAIKKVLFATDIERNEMTQNARQTAIDNFCENSFAGLLNFI